MRLPFVGEVEPPWWPWCATPWQMDGKRSGKGQHGKYRNRGDGRDQQAGGAEQVRAQNVEGESLAIMMMHHGWLPVAGLLCS